MDKNEKIKLGRKINTKVFGGNPYAETAYLREAVWAIAVLGNIIDGDKQKAQAFIDESQLKNNEVVDVLEKGKKLK